MIDWDDDSVKIGTLAEAINLLDQWIAAYESLRRDYLRLGLKLQDAQFDAHCGDVIADGYRALYEAVEKV